MDVAGGVIVGMSLTLFGCVVLTKGIKDIYEAGHIRDLTFVEDLEIRGVILATAGLALAVAGAFIGVING